MVDFEPSKVSPEDFSLGILTPNLGHAGGGLYYSVREPRLELMGYPLDITVYGEGRNVSKEELSNWHPLHVHPTYSIGPKKFGFVTKLYPQLLKHSVLHQHGLWTYQSILSSRWRRETGRPSVISAHGMLDKWALENSSWKKRPAMRLYERRNLNTASCLHALNESEACSMRQLGLRNPIAIIPNGVYLQRCGKDAEHGVKTTKSLLFLGRIHPKKGLQELLEAWRMLFERRLLDEWTLRIAGWDDGGHLAKLQTFVQKSNLTKNVEFLGPVFGQRKDDLYRTADAFILPSFSEGLPMAVLEAWSFGVPVFMTPECNLSAAFSTSSAIEIDTNPTSMAQTLGRELADHSKLGEFGTRGLRLVEEKYTWNRIAGEMFELYLWLQGKVPTPPFIEA